VFTGVSGSGKSSLAFDTLYAEGQRRYIESLSAYARQFLGQLERPKVEHLRGLSPTIAIEQKSASATRARPSAPSPRSTTTCACSTPASGTSTAPSAASRSVAGRSGADRRGAAPRGRARGGERRKLPARPIVTHRKGEYKDSSRSCAAAASSASRSTARSTASTRPKLDKKKKHIIAVVVDRVTLARSDADASPRAVELGPARGQGRDPRARGRREPRHRLQRVAQCCGKSASPSSTRRASRSTARSACARPATASAPAWSPPRPRRPRPQPLDPRRRDRPVGHRDGARRGLDLPHHRGASPRPATSTSTPPGRSSPRRSATPSCTASRAASASPSSGARRAAEPRHLGMRYEGVIPNLMRRYRETDSEDARALPQVLPRGPLRRLRGQAPAPRVARREGRRARHRRRHRDDRARRRRPLQRLGSPAPSGPSPRAPCARSSAASAFLLNVGLDYLTLDRSGPTLSGGEAQRIRLASQLGSELSGVMYVLDEPSIGLHQRDNQRLIARCAPARSRQHGARRRARRGDHPRRRPRRRLRPRRRPPRRPGGVQRPPPRSSRPAKASAHRRLPVRPQAHRDPDPRRKPKGAITSSGAPSTTSRNVDVASRSACSSRSPASAARARARSSTASCCRRLSHAPPAADRVGAHKSIEGLAPSTRSSPSTSAHRPHPALEPRHLHQGPSTRSASVFASSPRPRARLRGRALLFNVKGGRCEACQGDGVVKVEMHFLSDVYVTCEVCEGKRYNDATLAVRYKGKNIADILDPASTTASRSSRRTRRSRASCRRSSTWASAT
jgi:excinuclease ABC subunit A